MTEGQESFISHLVELRQRLVRAVASVAAVFVVLFLYPGSGFIYDLLAAPLMQALPEGSRMIATGVITPFMVPVKVTALMAFMIALPYVLYQAWAFVAPGLYEHEKKLAVPLVVGSTLLFLLGVGFCYFFVFGKVFSFINEFAPKSITPAPDIEAYFGFVMTMFLAFGVTFEIPIVVLMLVKTGLVTIEKLKEARPYVIVGAFVVAAVVTPPDVLSQFMLAVPMCLLYEAGIFFARFISPSKTVPQDSADPAH
ncbi:MAG TPA: twin-arginine translocase subunit TatC [Burkholderiales bacterium]|nr:twin-arginine translocase subunit TatC [Burkholderiales bacterium]